MEDWRDLRSVATADVRRFERAASEPWQHEALRIARAFVALCDREEVTHVDTAPLLLSAAKLPTRDGQPVRAMLMRTHVALAGDGCAIAPADLVIDPHGRLVIVARRASRPPPDWIDAQLVPPPQGGVWWTAWPLEGGAVVVPQLQLFGLGRADLARCRERVEHATVDQVRQLLTLVPELVNQLRAASR